MPERWVIQRGYSRAKAMALPILLALCLHYTAILADQPKETASKPVGVRPVASRPNTVKEPGDERPRRQSLDDQVDSRLAEIATKLPETKRPVFHALFGDYLTARFAEIDRLDREARLDEVAKPGQSREYRKYAGGRARKVRAKIDAIRKTRTIPLPPLDTDSRSGIGELPPGLKQLKVFQIVDSDRMLVRASGYDRTFLLELPTAGYVDDQQVDLAGRMMSFGKTYEYTTVLGANSTVRRLAPADGDLVDAVETAITDPVVNRWINLRERRR